ARDADDRRRRRGALGAEGERGLREGRRAPRGAGGGLAPLRAGGVTPPPWIPLERVAALRVAHAWDDGNPFRVVASRDVLAARRCERISPRARIGFTLACAEWVLARFGARERDPRPWQYLEAR